MTSGHLSKKYSVQISKNDIDGKKISNSTILIEQSRMISKTRLFEYCGKLSEKKINEIEKQLQLFLDIKTPPHEVEGHTDGQLQASDP